MSLIYILKFISFLCVLAILHWWRIEECPDIDSILIPQWFVSERNIPVIHIYLFYFLGMSLMYSLKSQVLAKLPWWKIHVFLDIAINRKKFLKINWKESTSIVVPEYEVKLRRTFSIINLQISPLYQVLSKTFAMFVNATKVFFTF